MQNDNIRGGLGSKFEDFGSNPSEGLWGSIADSLDGKRKRKAAFWWWMGVAAIAVAGLGIVLTTTMDDEFSAENRSVNPSNDKNIISVDPSIVNGLVDTVDYVEGLSKVSVESDTDPSEQIDDILIANVSDNDTKLHLDEQNHDGEVNTDEIWKSDGLDGSNKSDATVVEQMEDIDLLNRTKSPSKDDQSDNTILADHMDVTEYQDSESRKESWESAEKIMQLPLRKIDFNYSELALAPITALKLKRRRWEMGVTLNSWSSVFNAKSDGLSGYSYDATAEENAILLDISNNYDVSVHRPIGLKYHIGFQLTRRLRIVSGISAEYTSYRYSQQMFEGDGANTAELSVIAVVPVKLTNIGVPIGVEFDFIKRRRFQMGTGIGVFNEFPFLETYRPNYDLNYSGTQSNLRNSITGYSLGLNFNLNASVYITDKMRIQANPGVRWYRSQKSTTSLYLQKRNFWLGGSLSMIWNLGK